MQVLSRSLCLVYPRSMCNKGKHLSEHRGLALQALLLESNKRNAFLGKHHNFLSLLAKGKGESAIADAAGRGASSC